MRTKIALPEVTVAMFVQSELSALLAVWGGKKNRILLLEYASNLDLQFLIELTDLTQGLDTMHTRHSV